MPTLLIRFKKRRTGESTMTCFREDGTATGQRAGAFFLWHDLEHYAVETTLGLPSAFYGMLARGWDLEDFGTPWPRGPFPADALPDLMLAESLAGAMDAERAGALALTAEWFNAHAAAECERVGAPPVRQITEQHLSRVRARYQELVREWEALPPGEVLELPFPAAVPPDRG